MDQDQNHKHTQRIQQAAEQMQNEIYEAGQHLKKSAFNRGLVTGIFWGFIAGFFFLMIILLFRFK